MSVVIRLQRKGRKKRPFYHVVAIDSRKRRDGRPIDSLGWFDPLTDELKLNAERYEHWISLGAKPSERVRSITRNKAQEANKS